jgi:hypothetical protein
MMLTENVMDKVRTEEVKTEGTRSKAAKFFSDNGVSDEARTQLLNATVRLKTDKGNASGVILASTGKGKAYVLTAKHVLYKLAGDKTPGTKKPADYNNQTFCNSVEIGYAPAALLGVPTQTAPVTAVTFLGKVCNDQNWEYDLVVFESTDATFRTHIEANRFITQDQKDLVVYSNLLNFKPSAKAEEDGEDEDESEDKKDGKGCTILNKELFEFFQLGYGLGKIKGVKVKDEYKNFEGKIQCKISSPSATIPVDGAYEIDKELTADKWPKSNNILLMDADATATSAPGDSGGPLFCRPKKIDKNVAYLANKSRFFLVGITSGANFFTDPKWTTAQKKDLPGDDVIHNNAVTFWLNVYRAISGG